MRFPDPVLLEVVAAAPVVQLLIDNRFDARTFYVLANAALQDQPVQPVQPVQQQQE